MEGVHRLKCRAGWREAVAEPGKKEQAEARAREAAVDTEWEALLN